MFGVSPQKECAEKRLTCWQTEATQGLRFGNALWVLMRAIRLLDNEMAANARSTYTLANPPEFQLTAPRRSQKLLNVTIRGV
jgi:hypothetical protein